MGRRIAGAMLALVAGVVFGLPGTAHAGAAWECNSYTDSSEICPRN